MKKILLIMAFIGVGFAASSQTLNPFPTTDSLRKFVNKWIRNSAVDAFTNLRLNTSLIGMTRFLDSAYGGQVSGFTYSADTIRLALLSGDTLKISLPSATGNSNLGSGFRLLVPSSQGIKTIFASNTVLVDSTSNTNGLTFKVDTSVIATVYDVSLKANQSALVDSAAALRTAISGIGGTTNLDTARTSTQVTITSSTGTDAIIKLVDVGSNKAGLVSATDKTKIDSVSLKANQQALVDTAAAKVSIAGHAATSILGRSANSTGNVADIVATVAGTFAKRGASTILWDSVDYADLKNTPDLQNPGVYFSPNETFNPGFVVFSTAIARPTNAFSNGTPVAWGILDDALHKYSFFDSAYANGGNQRLVVRYPQVKNVLNVSITPDEQFAGNNVTVGPSVGTTTFEAQVSRAFPLGMRLSGNGTTTWVANSGFGASGFFTISTYNTSNGQTGIIYSPTSGKDNGRPVIQYIGNNGYQVRRVYSGLGSNDIVFVLTDAFGNPVTVAPQTTDVVILSGFGMQSSTVQMATWSTGNNEFMASLSNFWVFGAFECWMVAAPVSSTSTLVRWQTDYPSATNYKIYRSSTGLHGTYTLIHTGTEGSYVDSGLTPGTLYTYKMEAVVGGVDTFVTTFNTNTKN